ncbi:hypothetical protein FRB97_007307 [Tulasnella sp. 331]|nr:hypothetical protein FRB97_007307 [Tulasnella sp. 331]
MRKHINTTDAGQVVMFTAGSYPTPPLQCSSNPLDPFLNALGFDNMTTADNRAASDKFQSLFYNTTANYMHAMLAAVRLDYGNQCPNFLTDPSLINQTFLETPELTPEEYTRYYNTAESSTQSFLDILRSDNAVRSYNWGLNLPLYDVESVYITAPYLCHFTVRKGAAQFVVSIAVATFSLFLTGWGVFQCFAPRFAIHEDPVGAMYCHAHKLESGTQPITRPKDVPDNRKNRTLKSKKSKRRAWTLFLQRRRLKNVAVSSQHTLPLHATANSIPNAVTHGSNPPSQAASLRRASSRHQHSVDPASVALPESPAPSLQTGQS